MKLKFPFKGYTDEQIKSVHGDERMRRLVANDTLTSENLTVLFAVLALLFVAGGLLYSIIF